MESKTTRKRSAYFSWELKQRLSINETLVLMANSILFWLTKAKGKKGAIVAMIVGTKAQTVIAIIKKHHLTTEYSFWIDMAANMGLIAKKCFPNTTCVTDDLLLFLF
jgi:hypothetical protein